MEMRTAIAETAWARGRFDARRGESRLLFGRMHEDSSIETRAFPPGGRIFCIAAAGCTAMELSRRHEVVAVDINPAQVAYAGARFSGAPASRGTAERMMDRARALAPLAGWRRSRVREFLELGDPAEQIAFWRRHLDTLRFRMAMDAALSRVALRAVYAKPFLACVPRRFGAVMRRRMERCFARHSNRDNPYARALLLGETTEGPPPPQARGIRLVRSDAAAFLERERPESYDGFALSNILDGASDEYRLRLTAAVRRAAAPGSIAVLRSFAEPGEPARSNLAGEDRAMLWGVVEARAVDAL
jgi:S-adenosylmethionine:diacylglycerol 3-amino-3-carboxypropyl transferase